MAPSRGVHLSAGRTIHVENPDRLLECAHLQRQQGFQRIIRRYLSQILYGCTSTYCTTPTCRSCTERIAIRPYRPPTQLTARSLAHFLANQHDPYRGLCPHQLKVAPESIQIEGAYGVELLSNDTRRERWFRVSPAAGLPLSTAAERCIAAQRGGTTSQCIGTADSTNVDRVVASIDERHQSKKDLRSLGQNLYDSVTVIYSFSKQLPSTKEMLQALQASLRPNQPNLIGNDNIIDSPPAVTGNFRTNGTSSGCPTNGHPVCSLVKNSVPSSTSTSHYPQNGVCAARSSIATPSGLEVLDNGDRVHKIQHRLSEPRSKHSVSEHVANSPTLNGTRDVSRTKKTMRIPHASSVLDRPKPGSPHLIPPMPEGSLGIQKDSRQTASSIEVASSLTSGIMESFKKEIYQHRNDLTRGINFPVDFEPDPRFCPNLPFVDRTIFFHLSNTEALLQSFRNSNNPHYSNSPLPHLDAGQLVSTFQSWDPHHSALIFDSLWCAVQALFIPPPEIDSQKSPRLKPSRKVAFGHSLPKQETSGATIERYLGDEEVAHIVMICIHALTSSVSVSWPHMWIQLRNLRSWGVIIPDSRPNKEKDFSEVYRDPWLKVVDQLENEPALRLAEALLQGLGARMCFERITAALSYGESPPENNGYVSACSPLLEILVKHLIEVERIAIANKKRLNPKFGHSKDPGWTVTATLMEWLRTVIIKKWDGKATVNKWSSVGVSMAILHRLNAQCDELNLRPQMFSIPFLHDRIAQSKESIKFLEWEPQPNMCHIFHYPCLFQAEHLIGYFRTINFTSMCKQYQHSEQISEMQRHLGNLITPPFLDAINNHMKLSLSDFLVLEVGREKILEDTLNQLWGQEKRLFLKPLKVKMGTLDGELGHDQGGVTYEYFRVVLEEAFKPDYGMFVVDQQTSMTWFQPGSIEPDWKFEMLGILFSLAVYNGVTLPVTFPIAFYSHLLASSHQHTVQEQLQGTDFIRDGWPTLAKSFDQLLSWDDGDVEEVFFRQYSFSYTAFGHNVDVNMRSPDGGESEETPLVTNANRRQYVADYITWLTYKSVIPQVTAFAKGFCTCLHPKSLQLFNPQSLRNLIEGTQVIDIAAWQNTTRYEDGYSATHSTVIDFWSVVKDYCMEDRRKLLEFVTASDRVPITGFSAMNFHIVRNGPDTEALPTSSTCFGKLMLPEYSSKEKMKKKLDLAIQYSKGFGVV